MTMNRQNLIKTITLQRLTRLGWMVSGIIPNLVVFLAEFTFSPINSKSPNVMHIYGMNLYQTGYVKIVRVWNSFHLHTHTHTHVCVFFFNCTHRNQTDRQAGKQADRPTYRSVAPWHEEWARRGTWMARTSPIHGHTPNRPPETSTTRLCLYVTAAKLRLCVTYTHIITLQTYHLKHLPWDCTQCCF